MQTQRQDKMDEAIARPGRRGRAVMCAVVGLGLLATPLTAALPAPAAKTFDVCASGCKYTDIQRAVDAVAGGGQPGVVRVARGTYFVGDIDVSTGMSVTIEGGWADDFSSRSDDPSRTVIAAIGADPIFEVEANEEDIALTLKGVTLKGGYARSGGAIQADVDTGAAASARSRLDLSLNNTVLRENEAYLDRGGAISIEADTDSDNHRSRVHFEMTDSRVVDNQANQNGGAIRLTAESDPSAAARTLMTFSIEDNVFVGNSAVFGGAIDVAMYRSDYELSARGSAIRRNEISGNQAANFGALRLFLNETDGGTIPITNNLLGVNESLNDTSAKINSFKSDSLVNIINNTIVGTDGYGLVVTSRSASGAADNLSVSLMNNIAYGHAFEDVSLRNEAGGNLVAIASHNLFGNIGVGSVDYNDGGDNLSGDPLLGDDFHPRMGSPVVDAGVAGSAPATDLVGKSRSGPPDVGAFEYQGDEHQARIAAPTRRVDTRYGPLETPVVSSHPEVARPIGVGDRLIRRPGYLDAGVLKLRIKLPAFSGPVDVYAGIYSPDVDNQIYQFAPGRSLRTLSEAGPVPWKSGISGPVDESPFGTLDVRKFLPEGKYYLYLWVTPHDELGWARYAYQTYFRLL